MKKVKIGFWILLIAFLLLMGYQNKSYFLEKNTFGLDLYVTNAYMTPEIHNGVAFFVVFLAGLIIAYLSGLMERFRSSKTIKQLNADIEKQRQEIDRLNTELNALKNAAASPASMPAAEDEANEEAAATQVLS